MGGQLLLYSIARYFMTWEMLGDGGTDRLPLLATRRCKQGGFTVMIAVIGARRSCSPA